MRHTFSQGASSIPTTNCRSVIYYPLPQRIIWMTTHLCDLDSWPIDLGMVHNTSPHGFYSCHMWIQPTKIAWFIAGIFLVECVGSVYAPSMFLSYLWGEIKERWNQRVILELPLSSGPLCSLSCTVALWHTSCTLSLVDVSGDGWVGDLCTDPMHSIKKIRAIKQVIFLMCYRSVDAR